ncbi:MAG: NADH-quinone oxidoreductase subunit D [Holosporales bacterium]|jgi:NADH-quinone oxidoreductase subunit D|nr:NADH-quinone oxidoreductase subunit D [Holosporales bacterium]
MTKDLRIHSIVEDSKKESYELNYGPHHPSTHGVLRLILTLVGEEITGCEPIIGYLHRGVEKIVEKKKFISIIPYVDRLDYLSSLIMEHSYAIAIEKLNNIEVPIRARFIRTILDELTRISSHLMSIGSMTYDLGCLSLFLYSLEEREKIMNIFDEITGARMHQAYYVPGGVLSDLDQNSIKLIETFIKEFDKYHKAVQKLALDNRIFRSRTKRIGTISKELAMTSGISGINLRASGIDYDIRNRQTYGVYDLLNFQSLVLQDGDSYARVYLRFLEIRQSAELVSRGLSNLPSGQYSAMEFNSNIRVPPESTVYSPVESPRGEFGIHLITDKDGLHPHRMHFKAPSFGIIQLIPKLVIGAKLADCTAILGSLDFLLGDCDR